MSHSSLDHCVNELKTSSSAQGNSVLHIGLHMYISAHQQCFILNCKCSPQSKYFDVGRRTPITPTALCWLAVRCWYVCKPQHGRLLGVALYGCSCLDCTSWHLSVSMSSFPLPLTHTSYTSNTPRVQTRPCMLPASC